jgi:hypothetical protein
MELGHPNTSHVWA